MFWAHFDMFDSFRRTEWVGALWMESRQSIQWVIARNYRFHKLAVSSSPFFCCDNFCNAGSDFVASILQPTPWSAKSHYLDFPHGRT